MPPLPHQPLPQDMERILAISAHPDDSEFHGGGTIARLAQAGLEVSLVVCTDGSKGGRDLTHIIETRRDEQYQAAERLGISAVTMLGFPDGELKSDDELLGRLVEEIRRARPHLILTHHPATYYRTIAGLTLLGHSDHRAAGTAVFDAIYPRAASRNFYPGRGGKPWQPREVWLFDPTTPDYAVDISDGIDNKLAALAAHKSQQDDTQQLSKAALAASEHFSEQSRPGEGFQRLILRH